jgi:uncharacterized repeat protein (TIGR01451 family)/MYXO-CTERM domain-containing protein
MRSASLSFFVAAAIFAGAANAQQLRFSTTVPGDVVAVGNTLGLSKETGLNGPGTADAIGTFITLDTTSVDNEAPLGTMAWPMGTTNDWTSNGSTAVLTLPVESQVLYAELVWGGSHEYVEDVSAFLDDPVTLSFGGDTLSVMPDPATATTVELNGSFVIRYYMRSANVTDFVAQHGEGTYAVEGVPGTQAATINSTNAAGWSIIVAYRYDGEPIRNLSVFAGDTAFVDENTTVDYTVSGFCAPPAGDIEGTIAIATVEGDANRVGDQLAIGETAISTFVNLSGPNNPADNFFCSQINGPDGQLDTSGSFGMANHVPGTNAVGARQGWDVAHVALSSADGQLVPGQTSAVLRTQTLDDSYMPVLAGIAIDVNAPTFLYQASTTEVDKTEVMVGDSLQVTVTLLNEGSAAAQGVHFTLPLPAGIDLAGFSTNGTPGDIGGNPVVLADLATGVDMGDLAPGDQRVLVIDLQVAAPQQSVIFIQPVWQYSYTQCVGSPADESFTGESVPVSFIGEGTGGGGQGGAGPSATTGAGPGATTGSSAGEGGADGGEDGDLDEGGCSCDCTVGDGTAPSRAWLSLFAIALFAWRRRRA